jgi:hypothetical protein
MLYVAIAVVVVVAVSSIAPVARMHHRNAPLRREMKAQAVTFRTDLRWVKISARPWWLYGAEDGMKGLELTVQGDMFRVGDFFSALIGMDYYFRAWETTVEVSRDPLGICGIGGKREWIVVTGTQDGRDFRLEMTKKYFLDDVWNALVRAGAVARGDGPAGRRPNQR